nr:unnamed protein product [Digitaria exilis]
MQTPPASSLECVSSCRAGSWKGGGRPYECSVLSCAWNAPRALTGALASTAQCSSCGHAEAGGGWRRRGRSRRSNNSVRSVSVIRTMELDWESIAAGLLHDTVEDTDVVTFERIENEFGPTVRRIVEGETKVSKLGKLQCNEGSSKQDIKAEDLRQMFLAMTEEVRVVIVKLADRLHNMRTLTHMPQHKQYAIAMETLQVFAPLAKLLGMYRIKSELEYLSFMYVNPIGFAELRKRVEDLYKAHEQELEEANRILRQKIAEDQFLDLICYHVLGLVHGIWTPIPQAVKDYIATPKPNGYQSLHTTVIPFLNESMFHLEVQIRTEDMDLIAERGIAAHYSGRGVVSGPVRPGISSGRNSKGKVICLNNTGFALRVLYVLYYNHTDVFTAYSTVVDYAYLIHTEIGNKMIAAKVNGNLVSPIHVLANAEVVEIITYDKLSSKYAFQRHQQWLHHAKTRSARHKIMKFLREQAALSAAEITAEAVNNFVADLEDESDRMMAEVTSALTACGITICSCVAEVNKRRGMGVVLFHFEGSYENVVSACSSVDLILGVLGWSVGCSWCPMGVLEC